MSLRINLIKKDELREAGALSQGFIIRLIIIIAVSAVLLGVGLLVLHSRNVKQQLLQTKGQFRRVDPLFQDVKAMQDDLDTNLRLLDELNSLAASRNDWKQTLLDLQKVVPDNMQLTKLSIHESIEMISHAKWKNLPPSPARRFTMRLDGKIVGEMADAVVGSFIRDLTTSELFEPIMQSAQMKGQGLQRDMGPGGGGQTRWTYGIEAVGKPREMKMEMAPKKEDKEKKRGSEESE